MAFVVQVKWRRNARGYSGWRQTHTEREAREAAALISAKYAVRIIRVDGGVTEVMRREREA